MSRPLHSLPLPMAAAYIRDILEGMNYIHSNGIVRAYNDACAGEVTCPAVIDCRPTAISNRTTYSSAQTGYAYWVTSALPEDMNGMLVAALLVITLIPGQ